MIFGSPAMAFSAEEAANLAQAVWRVQRLNRKSLAKISPEAKAWTNLALVGLSVYGPRLAVLWMEAKMRRKAAAVNGKPFVVQQETAPGPAN